MELQEAIRTRRSVRQFTDEKVPHALLEQVVELASWAPSWKNTQISRYIAIEDPAVLAEICAHYVPEFNARIIGGCKTLVVQTFVKARSGFERDGSFSTDREDGWQHYDCGIAAQTFALAAHDLAWAVSSWVSSTARAWKSTSRSPRARRSWPSSPWASPPHPAAPPPSARAWRICSPTAEPHPANCRPLLKGAAVFL